MTFLLQVHSQYIMCGWLGTRLNRQIAWLVTYGGLVHCTVF